jgi:hypothetical protein
VPGGTTDLAWLRTARACGDRPLDRRRRRPRCVGGRGADPGDRRANQEQSHHGIHSVTWCRYDVHAPLQCTGGRGRAALQRFVRQRKRREAVLF